MPLGQLDWNADPMQQKTAFHFHDAPKPRTNAGF